MKVTATDGVRLAVQVSGRATGETVVLVHGYPDNHTVWDGIVAELADDFRLVSYDVRGCGDSEAPRSRSGYRIEQLAADLGSVLDAVAADGPVHLVAHDWGSIQMWGAVCAPEYGARLASFTSISGPSLDMAAVWLRDVRGHGLDSLRQLMASHYVALFQLPWLPEAMHRSGITNALLTHSMRAGIPSSRTAPTAARDQRDLVNGLELYRANFVSRMTRPDPQPTSVPTLVIAPRHDPHVTAALALGAPVGWVSDLTTEVVEGNHWVIEQEPGLIAGLIRDQVAAH